MKKSIYRRILDAVYPTVPRRAWLRSLLVKSVVGEPPVELQYVGGAPWITGDNTLEHIMKIAPIQDDARVLDVGCGNGRIAAAMQRKGLSIHSYNGMDIVKSGIDWCDDNLRRPGYFFVWMNWYNSMYNPGGREGLLPFPYCPEAFDYMIVNSVFTHMLPENVEHYLKQMWIMAKKGCIVYVTFFLWDTGVAANQRAGKSAHNFPYNYGYYHTLRSHLGKEGMVSYDKNWIYAKLNEIGWRIRDGWRGCWSDTKQVKGDQEFLFQDVLVLEKL